MSVRMLLAVLAIALLTAARAEAQVTGAQGAAAGTVSVEARFQGATLVRSGARVDSVRVDIRVWTIAGGQRITALDVPIRGVMIVELRGGQVTTIIDGLRVERRAGEIWSVPAGSTMQLETGNDMATLQTTVVGG